MWSFEIEEVSNGTYSCIGTRTTGNVVSFECGEEEIYRVFEDAFKVEVELGTFPAEALFNVVSGSKPYWDSKYEEQVFGSWVVENPTTGNRYIYDGRDFILIVYKENEKPTWQGHFKAGENVNSEFLKELL